MSCLLAGDYPRYVMFSGTGIIPGMSCFLSRDYPRNVPGLFKASRVFWPWDDPRYPRSWWGRDMGMAWWEEPSSLPLCQGNERPFLVFLLSLWLYDFLVVVVVVVKFNTGVMHENYFFDINSSKSMLKTLEL